MTVAIIDYGSGNLRSAAKAFERRARELNTGDSILVTGDPDAVAKADRVVLPGVGAFGDCRRGLERLDGMVEALTEAAVGRGVLVLDLACGTGDLAELAAERGARVIGVDFARAMLRSAHARAPRLGFAQADAACLPLRSASSHVNGCGFALRNFTDDDAVIPGNVIVSRAAVFAECARVLAPRGRLVLLEVDTPRVSLLRALHGLYFRGIVPRLGAWLADADAYRYLPASTVYLPEDADLRARLAKAGFATVRKRALCFGAVQCVIAVRPA